MASHRSLVPRPVGARRSVRRGLALVLAALATAAAALGTPAPAAAQPDRVLVLRSVPGQEPPGFAAAADLLEESLRREQTALLRDLGARLIAERHSAEAQAASQDDFDALARESEQALEHVAFGRRRQAREAVARILERAQGALEALNREARSARRVLNSCLYLVRALADADDRDAALAQSTECARLVPDMAPSAAEHPPQVRELFAQAAEQMAHGPHGSLRLTSEPSDCDVYLNGRRLGRTPFFRERLPTGEYRVQVECRDGGRPGRVHRVILSAEPRQVHIDGRFDTVLRTGAGELRLEYAEAEDEEVERLADAVHVAEIVGATELLLLTSESADRLRVDRVRTDGPTVLASVRVALSSAGLRRRDATAAVEALFTGRSVDLRHEPPEEMSPWAPPAPPAVDTARAPRDDGTPRGGAQLARAGEPAEAATPVAGIVLGAAGVLTLGVAWGMEGLWLARQHRVQVAEPTDPDYGSRVDDRDALRLPTALVGLGGAALATGALPLLLGDGGATWWHWALGGVGVVGAAIGALLWTQEGDCTDARCNDRHRTVPLAPLLLSTSAPLLATPLIALLLDGGSTAGAESVALVPGIDRDGGGIALWGAFQ